MTRRLVEENECALHAPGALFSFRIVCFGIAFVDRLVMCWIVCECSLRLFRRRRCQSGAMSGGYALAVDCGVSLDFVGNPFLT